MDYSKQINELRDKIKGREDTDFAKCDLYQREIQKELIFKREQVIELQKEVQSAHGKLFEQKKELENTKYLLKESEFNMNLAMKKAATVNEKFKSVNDAFITFKLKEDMRVSENQMLNENLQTIGIENHRLKRENEELKNKLKYYNASYIELEDNQMKLNASMSKIRENMDKLQKEQTKVADLEVLLLTTEEYKKNCELFKEINKNLQKENVKLENKMIEITGKYEKLYELIKTQKGLHNEGHNILGNVKYLQWKIHHKKLEDKNVAHEKIIKTLTDTLNQEIESNAHLLLQNEDYYVQIEELQNKLSNIKVIKEEESVIQLD